MKTGTLYGIGIGPGDPDLLTIKGAWILARCRHVFVPKARRSAKSVTLSIAQKYITQPAEIHEVVFPMTEDNAELKEHWMRSADQVAGVLQRGQDACFLTLGDALLYSTYIYLIRSLRQIMPDTQIITVPGVTAFSAAAALASQPVGEAKQVVTIVPTTENLETLKTALATSETVVLMKVGKKLSKIIDLLEEKGVIGQSVLVSRAGMEGQRIETKLHRLKKEVSNIGYLSTIIINTNLEPMP